LPPVVEVVMDAGAIEWIKKAVFEVGIYYGIHEIFWPCSPLITLRTGM
jgi:hypothetical protein